MGPEFGCGRDRGRGRRGSRVGGRGNIGENYDGTGGMDQAAQSLANVAAANALQTATMAAQNQQNHIRAEQAAKGRSLTTFRRQDPSQFHGDADPKKADLWIQELENIFELIHSPEGVKVPYATFLLMGDAKYWWKGSRQLLEADNQEVTWNVFRNMFLDKYFPQSARAEKE